MNEEELLRRDNFLMSHGNLPYDTTTCETYGLSGNCGQKCPNFKNKTCEVYVDVLERENQKYKEVIDKAMSKLGRYADELTSNGNAYAICIDLLEILKEVE